ncbi:MAG: helix-turn-helix domain-containing protein [Synergistaceae bacterium]|jgi:transcriptional regulator with XRE-family HTH domain|nr:helix-turn-helix domain-containing protein [Synergistaceae bacterium]
MSLGRRLRTLRKNNSLTQQSLADTVGVSRIYIQALESNRRMPSMKLLYKLAEALKASVTDIVDGLQNKTGRMQLDDLLSSGEVDIWYRARKLSGDELKRVDRVIYAVLDEWDKEDGPGGKKRRSVKKTV